MFEQRSNQTLHLACYGVLCALVLIGGFFLTIAPTFDAELNKDSMENFRDLQMTTAQEKEIESVEKLLGPFKNKPQINIVQKVSRNDYIAKANQDWTGSLNIGPTVTEIELAAKFLTPEIIRYYLARARLYELTTNKTSPWVKVGLPHLVSTNDGFDKESYTILKATGLPTELNAPDLIRIKKDPAYRDQKGGEAWFVMYYLKQVKNYSPLEIIIIREEELPTSEELACFFATLE